MGQTIYSNLKGVFALRRQVRLRYYLIVYKIFMDVLRPYCVKNVPGRHHIPTSIQLLRVEHLLLAELTLIEQS